MASHCSMASTPSPANRQGCFVPSARRRISPAVSRTFRCREIAGCVISNGSASSITVASPLANRARIDRRVGSERAANTPSSCCITSMLYNYIVIFNTSRSVVHELAVEKVGSRVVGLEPGFLAQKVVDLVWKHQIGIFHALL